MLNKPVLRQDWLHLLFLHWRIPADALRAILPPALEVDSLQGAAWVGLIPFTIRNSRPSFAPAIPYLGDFHEVNVRTYVRHQGRPGVFFFSLDASSRSAVIAARPTFRLPYHFARIEMSIDDRVVQYHSERKWPKPLPANCSIRYRVPEEPLDTAKPGTVEHFLVERYTLFTESAGRIYEAEVEHKPYRLQKVALEKVEETMTWAARLEHSEDAPLAHYCPGLNVGINRLVESRR